MNARILNSNVYASISAALSQLQMGDRASDHRAELESWQGWNYVAIQAVMDQVSRSQAYVYDDQKDPKQREIRKSLRAERGWNWRKSTSREARGEVVESDHPLLKLLNRPNPAQSGASFRSEQILQLRLHGSAIVFNRPNQLHTRTVERYVIPMALIEPVQPTRKMPRGGIRIRPNGNMANLARAWEDGMTPVSQFLNWEIPVEMLSIARKPHPYLRGDGSSPSSAIARWIDTASHIDGVRMDFYGYGPNGQVIIQADGDDVTPDKCREWERELNKKLGPDGPQVVVIGRGQSVASQRTADEMGFEQGHEQMRNGIFSAHRVSRTMVGDQDSMTYGAVEASLWAATLLSIQPEMDLLADEDTLDFSPEYGGNLTVEYEIPPVESPETQDARLAQDAMLGVMTVGEYRKARNWEPFDDERSEMMMTAEGPVPVDTFLGKGKAKPPGGKGAPPGIGGGKPGGGNFPSSVRPPAGNLPAPAGQDDGPSSGPLPWQFSYSSPITKSGAMTTFDFPPAVIGMEIEGTLVDFDALGKPRLTKGCRDAIGILNKCGCQVEAVTEGDAGEAQQMLAALGLAMTVNTRSEYDYVWDDVAEGYAESSRMDGLRRVADALDFHEPVSAAIRAILDGNEGYPYGAVILPVADPIETLVRSIAGQIPAAHLASDGVEKQPHVTAIYGLSECDPKQVVAVVRKAGAPTIVIGEAFTFPAKPGSDSVPLVMAVESEQLRGINESLRENLPHVQLHDGFNPHLTLAYIRPEFADLYVGPNKLTGLAVELATAVVDIPGNDKVHVPLRDRVPERLLPREEPGAMIQAEHSLGFQDSLDRSDDQLFTMIKSLSDKIDLMQAVTESADDAPIELEPVAPIEVAGLAVLAQDTGRLLMLQRALSDDDPAAGDWEFPGGHIEDGERPIDAAKREWSEETGHVVPNGREVAAWDGGIYRGHIWLIKNESQVKLNLSREEKHVLNPDDPDGDEIEVVAWYSPGQIVDNGALRSELREAMPDVMDAIQVARTQFKQPVDWNAREKEQVERRDPLWLDVLKFDVDQSAGLPVGEIEKSGYPRTGDTRLLHAMQSERVKQGDGGNDGLIAAATLGKKLIANFGDWATDEEIESVSKIADRFGMELVHENEAGDLERLFPGCKIIKSMEAGAGRFDQSLAKRFVSELLKSSKEFREEDHPRDKDGKFISKEKIIAAAASGDSEGLKELIGQVRDGDLQKLEGALKEAGASAKDIQAAEDSVGRGEETPQVKEDAAGDGQSDDSDDDVVLVSEQSSRALAAHQRRLDYSQWSQKINDLEKITGKDITESMDEMIVGGYAEQNKWLDQKIDESLQNVAWEVDDEWSTENLDAKFQGSQEPPERAAERREWSSLRAGHRDRFKRSLATSDLDDAKKSEYLGNMQEALNVMPKRAFEKLEQNLHETKWHKSLAHLTIDMEEAGLKSISNNIVRGAYVHSGNVVGGTVHLDGGEDAPQVYIHEFAHAVDHDEAVGRISDSDEWKQAWESEISDGSISQYATTQPGEGWAEFARYAWWGGPDKVRQTHPKASAIFEKFGLL